MLKTILLATMVATATARCASDCSGHGTCDQNDRCGCYANWQGGDCSERTCPFGESWATTVSGNDNGHTYTECSSRGACDRKTGLCECDSLYDGFACNRHNCVNECNGHGTCETMAELGRATAKTAAGQTSSLASKRAIHDFPVANTATYAAWDAHKSRSCVCDGGWSGSACDERLCPRGDDPLTAEVDITQTITTSVQTHEVQNVSIVAAVDQATGRHYNMNGGEVTFTYTDLYNSVWTTRPVTLPLVKTWDGHNSYTTAAVGANPGTGQVLNIQPAIGWLLWSSAATFTLSTTKIYTTSTLDGTTGVYMEATASAAVNDVAKGGYNMKKGDWIAMTDATGVATCHLQVYETFSQTANTKLKIVVDPIQPACKINAATAIIYHRWQPYMTTANTATYDGSTGTKRVKSLDLVNKRIEITALTGTTDIGYKLTPGVWIRLASATNAHAWCDMMVSTYPVDSAAYIYIDPTTVTSTEVNSPTGTQVLCEAFTASAGPTLLDGTVQADDIALYWQDNVMGLGSATDSYGAGVTTDTWKIDTSTNIVTRMLANGNGLAFDDPDAFSMMPGSLISLVSAAGFNKVHTTVCSAVIKTGPVSAQSTLTLEAGPATIAGIAQTSCLSYLSSSQSGALWMMINQAGNSVRYTGADARAPNWFTGVAAGDMLSVSGYGGDTEGNAISAAAGAIQDDPTVLRLHVARVSSDGSAVHFSHGAAPGGGGAFGAMAFHDAASGNVPLVGQQFIFGGALAFTLTWASGGTANPVKNHVTTGPDHTGDTTIIQSYSAGSCGWCTTDADTVSSAQDAERALHELPNQVIQGASVTMNGNSLGRYGYNITFGAANAGDQRDIIMQGAGCNEDGCQPRYHGVYIQQVLTYHTATLSLTAATNKYSLVGTTTTSGHANGDMITQGECSPTGGEKFVPYYYVAAGDSTGTVLDADGCTTAGGIQFSTDSVIVSTANTMHTILRLRKLSDFREYDAADYTSLQDKSNTFFRSVTTEITRGTTEATVCSGRGNCDTSSGLCECFEGYTGESCSSQTVLM